MSRIDRVGIVVIGRNEGPRLQRCIESVVSLGAPVIYVDSDSSDESLDVARAMGIRAISLDTTQPLSAARGRNEGLAALRKELPKLEYVQFVDGDCEVHEGWLSAASEWLDRHPETAIVCGRLCERNPEDSIYNQIAQIEWDQPSGEIPACGGLFAVRVQPFVEIGGFDPSVRAGEEPEMCERIRAHGWKIVRLGAMMAWHDAAMRGFGDWWTRQLRTGRYDLDMARRFGHRPDRLYVRPMWSARIWVGGWLGTTLLMTSAAWATGGGRMAALAAMLAVVILAAQMLRIGVRTMREGYPARLSLFYGWLSMVAKFGHIVGQVWYLRDQLTGRAPPAIEYKGSDTPSVSRVKREQGRDLP